MEIIIAKNVAAHRPIAPRVHSARVVRLETYVVYLVELDNMVVAGKTNPHMGRVFD